MSVQALLAALPLLVILVAMLALRWSAARAGAAGLAVTLLIAWFGFGYGTRVLPDLGVGLATGGALAEALFIAATILWIIFPALCIHELQLRTGAIDVLRLAMGRLSNDPRIVALLVAWFFVLFVEGAAGFGTSVALAAPFLVSAGFRRVEAVTIALVGHAVGVSFGAVGTPVLAQVAVTPFTGLEIAAATGIYHGLVGWLMPLVAMLLVTRSLPRDQRLGAGAWGWTLLAAALFLVPHTLIATFVGPELPTLGGALIGAVGFVAALLLTQRLQRRGAERSEPVPTATDASGASGDALATSAPATHAATVGPRVSGALRPSALLRAAAPYLVLVVAVLVTRLVPSVQEALSNVTIAWSADAFSASFAPLYHPGTMLLLGFAVGAAWQRAAHADVVRAMRLAALKLAPVTVALVAMLGLSRLMVYAGMVDALASAAALAAGAAWPLFAPFVGMLGTFVTGSATASNILFTDFQVATAERLELSVLALLGAQGFGAAVGNIVCPHNIIAAGATVNLTGKEGEVLRRTLGVALLYALLGGLLALLVFA
ncbi:MAG: L-lactate permease [Trueperaceae bacterium]|nr:MAG: L-lactate permease [Trueperaceae bacterium]